MDSEFEKKILCTGDFFEPQMALAYRLDAISHGSKKSRFPGPSPLPLALVMDAARITSITHGPYKSCNTKKM
jgi:hypothetical protein